MVPFFVQIKCQLGKSYEVASKLADAEIASEIYSTAGDFDLLVKFYVEPSTDIGHFIAEKVQSVAARAGAGPSRRRIAASWRSRQITNNPAAAMIAEPSTISDVGVSPNIA